MSNEKEKSKKSFKNQGNKKGFALLGFFLLFLFSGAKDFNWSFHNPNAIVYSVTQIIMNILIVLGPIYLIYIGLKRKNKSNNTLVFILILASLFIIVPRIPSEPKGFNIENQNNGEKTSHLDEMLNKNESGMDDLFKPEPLLSQDTLDKLSENKIKDNEFKTYKNSDYGFSINIPSNASIVDGNSPITIKNIEFDQGVISIQALKDDTADGILNLNKSVKDEGSLSEFIKDIPGEIREYGEIIIDENPTYWVEIENNFQNIKIINTTYYLKNKNTYFTITTGTSPEDYIEAKKVFEKVINSIKFN